LAGIEKAKPIRIYLDSGIVDFAGGDDWKRGYRKSRAELRASDIEREEISAICGCAAAREKELEHIGLRRINGRKLRRASTTNSTGAYESGAL
jgi:hypothetical protein